MPSSPGCRGDVRTPPRDRLYRTEPGDELEDGDRVRHEVVAVIRAESVVWSIPPTWSADDGIDRVWATHGGRRQRIPFVGR